MQKVSSAFLKGVKFLITGALICEYNPFHNGHKYMIDMMRKDGCDVVVCIMSGSFTQRGDVAVYSKFTRTKEALKGGADVVIELPAVWAVSSAQRFAKGGCDIIKALANVSRVYFGSECGDIELLVKVANITIEEQVTEKLKEFMNEGDYYPVALTKAVENFYGKDFADILSSPNNTLAIEYIKALADSNIEVRTIKRTGVNHDSETTTEDIASASKIREMISLNENFAPFVPDNIDNCNPAFIGYGERAILMKLRELSEEDIKNTADVTEGLENRIINAARKLNTTEDILAEIKTKRYTLARLRRILICALLGITQKHLDSDVPYIRILGFSKAGEVFIRSLNNTATLPVIINVANSYQNLDESAKEIFDIDIKACDLRTVFEKTPTPVRADFTNGIVKI